MTDRNRENRIDRPTVTRQPLTSSVTAVTTPAQQASSQFAPQAAAMQAAALRPQPTDGEEQAQRPFTAIPSAIGRGPLPTPSEDRAPHVIPSSVSAAVDRIKGLPPEAADVMVDDIASREAQALDLDMQSAENRMAPLIALMGDNLSVQGRAALGELVNQTQQQIDSIESRMIETQQVMSAYRLLANPEQLASGADLQAAGMAPSGSQEADLVAQIVAESGISPDQIAASGVTPQRQNELARQGQQILADSDQRDVSRDIEGLSAEAASIYAEGNLGQDIADFQFETEMKSGLRDLVAQRRSITEQHDEMVGALQSEDMARTASQFQLDFDPSPQGAYEEAIIQGVTPLVDLSTARTEAEQEQVLTALLDLEGEVGQFLDAEGSLNQPQAIQAVNQFVATYMPGVNPETVIDELRKSRATGLATMEEVENVWETQRFTPGSRGMATALFQVISEDIGDPEIANQLANSPSFHMLIQVGSGGRVGAQRGATMSGLGGLSERQYRNLGYDPEEVKGNAQMELRALWDFIRTEFGGDPAAALAALDEQKGWG